MNQDSEQNEDIIEIDGTFYQKVTKDVKAGKIVNGKREGTWIGYHKNGEIAYKSNYLNGLLEGDNWSYYDNKKLKSHTFFKNGKLDEFNIFYHKNGQLAFKYKYKEFIQHGKQIEYHENGQLKFSGIYRNGKKDGDHREYYQNGQLWYKNTFENGVQLGPTITYWEDGRYKEKFEYRYGNKVLDLIYNQLGQWDDKYKYKLTSKGYVKIGPFG